MATYKMMGFNGAIGSIDCTHVKWSKCPTAKQNLCIGKEKYATVSFQCVVDHDKRVRLVSKVFWGAANDKEIVRNVPETFDIINGKYENVTYTLYDENGREVYVKGAYLIADGGFLKIGVFMDPSHQRWGIEEVRWSEFLESVRKDVECFFGILKSRFRILRHGMECMIGVQSMVCV